MISNDLRAKIVVYFLSLFPVLTYIVLKAVDVNVSFVLRVGCFLFLADMFITKYRKGGTIKIPLYLVLFGAFVCYTIYSGLFISGHLMEFSPMKFLYTDSYVSCFTLLLVIENTEFPNKILKTSIKIVFPILLIAAVVSIIQVSDPLFFVNMDSIGVGGIGSLQDIQRLIESGVIQKSAAGYLTVLIEDKRLPSIYSWINATSVGFDSVGIFSLLFGLGMFKQGKNIILVMAAAFISFLSSTRWIMLNFVLASFQTVLTQKNMFLQIGKYILVSVILVFSIGIGASAVGYDVQGFLNDRLLDDSASSRFYAFEIFGKVFPLSPVLGTGGANSPEMLRMLKGITSQIHVGWLKIFYYYGLLGGFMYLFFGITLLYRLRWQAIRSGYWGGFFALLGWFVANLTLAQFDIYFHGLMLAIIFSNSITDLKAFREPEPETEPDTPSYPKIKPLQGQLA